MLSGVFCFLIVLTEALAQVLKLPVQLLVDPEEADQVQPDQNSQLDCEDAPWGTAKSMKGEKRATNVQQIRPVHRLDKHPSYN